MSKGGKGADRNSFFHISNIVEILGWNKRGDVSGVEGVR